MTAPLRLLLLGGTTEAITLAFALANRSDIEVISSLAGRTSEHRLPPGRVRIGGFGGVPGLVTYLKYQAIDAVIDATHPFAARIAGNAEEACRITQTPRIKFLRPPWLMQDGDRWQRVASPLSAANAVASLGGRVFLSIGRQEIGAFYAVKGPRFLVRMIEPLDPLPPDHFDVLLARGPFDIESESALLERWKVSALVTKDSGGEATYPKIAAARQLGLDVILIDRPEPPPGEHVSSHDEAIAWIEGLLKKRMTMD